MSASTGATAGDQVKVSVLVDVEPAVAFEVFTTEIDRWWRRGVAYRVAGRRPGVLVLEPELGGRIFEQYETPNGSRTFERGASPRGSRPRASRSSGARATSSRAR